jgi:hypothetical protein
MDERNAKQKPSGRIDISIITAPGLNVYFELVECETDTKSDQMSTKITFIARAVPMPDASTKEAWDSWQ